MTPSENRLEAILKSEAVSASAPCRVDMGGTVDIRTFHHFMKNENPVTFNLALDLRTMVRIFPYTPNMVRITSKGFAPAEFHADALPFDHPLGLMFAACAYFNVKGVDIRMDSASVPKSGLGGSSAGVLALVAALARLCEKAGIGPKYSRTTLVKLAHLLEEDTAKSLCGCQDHLAAAYGWAHAWYWNPEATGPLYRRLRVIKKSGIQWLNSRFLVAFCGQTHVSARVNGKWIQQFLSGRTRHVWSQINAWTETFIQALSRRRIGAAVRAMNIETGLRWKMTPEVLVPAARELVSLAKETGCGARFTGAGGGGCVWALGEPDNISRLSENWRKAISHRDEAEILDAKMDTRGLEIHF